MQEMKQYTPQFISIDPVNLSISFSLLMSTHKWRSPLDDATLIQRQHVPLYSGYHMLSGDHVKTPGKYVFVQNTLSQVNQALKASSSPTAHSTVSYTHPLEIFDNQIQEWKRLYKGDLSNAHVLDRPIDTFQRDSFKYYGRTTECAFPLDQVDTTHQKASLLLSMPACGWR
jgi:hypothetical protein